MKKIIAILMSFVLLLGCVSGLAEGEEKQSFGTIRVNGVFTLKGSLPEGYKVVPFELSDDSILTRIISLDPSKPDMMLSIAFDETYSDVERLNDLDDEGLAILEKTFTDTDPYADITYEETTQGTRLLVCRTQSEVYDSLDIFSIYKGYFVEFVMTPSQVAADQKLTDEQVEGCIAFLSDLDFVEGEEVVALDLEGATYTANITGFDPEAKTIDISLLTPIVLTEWDTYKYNIGDTIKIGDDEILIATFDYQDTDGEYSAAVINDEYYLRKNEDGLFNPYFYDSPILQEAMAITVNVPDSLVFTDEIDSSTGMILDEKKTLTAADLFAALEEAKKDGVGFESQNVYVSFDENGELKEVDRFYTPWQ